jgi:hypothetical protein
VSVERDPELGKALDLALGSASAPYGAKLRVRQKLTERLAKSRSNAPALVAAALAGMACALALFFWLGRPAPPTAANVSPDRYSELLLSSARVLLRDDAELSVERDDSSGAVLRLTAGAALVHVRKGTGKSFEVVAGATRVRVVGTVFGVAMGPRGAAVVVREGVVDVEDRAGTRTLRAGETWPPHHGIAVDPAAFDRVSAPLPPGPTGELDAARTRAPPEPGPGGEPNAPNDDALARSASPVVPSRAPPAASAAPESAYSRARALERAGDAGSALAAYQAIVDGRGENVEDALFAIARLRAQQGEQRATLSAAKSYRSEFPTGRYARDNDVLVLNAELALGEQALALSEAELFLERFPNDPRAWRFRLVRAAERARRGDCSGARSDVETAPDGAAKRAVLERCAAERR